MNGYNKHIAPEVIRASLATDTPPCFLLSQPPQIQPRAPTPINENDNQGMEDKDQPSSDTGAKRSRGTSIQKA